MAGLGYIVRAGLVRATGRDCCKTKILSKGALPRHRHGVTLLKEEQTWNAGAVCLMRLADQHPRSGSTDAGIPC